MQVNPARAERRSTIIYLFSIATLTVVGVLGYSLWSTQNRLDEATHQLEVLASQTQDLESKQEQSGSESDREALEFSRDFEISRLQSKIKKLNAVLLHTSIKNVAVDAMSQELAKLKAENVKLKEQMALSQKALPSPKEIEVIPSPSSLPTPPTPTVSATPTGNSPAYQTASKWTRLDTGMTKAQVREILGPPTATTTLGKGLEIWHFGFSTVNFEADRVTEWTRI